MNTTKVHEHCWHDTQKAFLTHPKKTEEICCNCGEKQLLQFIVFSQSGKHGKFAPENQHDEIEIDGNNISIVQDPTVANETKRLPMTKKEIAKNLRALSGQMKDIATAMDYYGGFAHWARNAKDLFGAGNIATEWADEIEMESEHG